MKYLCPNCKTTYTSSTTPLEFCVCGGKLKPQDLAAQFYDLLGKDSPFSIDMFSNIGRRNGPI